MRSRTHCHSIVICLLSFMVFTNANAELRWVINPQDSVGKIIKTSSERDLIRIYGSTNVIRSEIYIGEGEVVLGSILYPNTNKQLSIEWKEEFSKPGRISLTQVNSMWRLDNGIAVGSTLDEVEKINGGPFIITGFEWDYPGQTVSWQEGRIPVQLQLGFDYNTNISQDEFLQVLGESHFSSQNKTIRKMNLSVKKIYIRWDK